MDDFQIRMKARIEALIEQAVVYGEQVMRTGSAASKNTYIRQVLPTMAKVLMSEETQDETVAELRDRMDGLFSQIRDSEPKELVPRPEVPE